MSVKSHPSNHCYHHCLLLVVAQAKWQQHRCRCYCDDDLGRTASFVGLGYCLLRYCSVHHCGWRYLGKRVVVLEGSCLFDVLFDFLFLWPSRQSCADFSSKSDLVNFTGCAVLHCLLAAKRERESGFLLNRESWDEPSYLRRGEAELELWLWLRGCGLGFRMRSRYQMARCRDQSWAPITTSQIALTAHASCCLLLNADSCVERGLPSQMMQTT